jgi:hypothetical protein
MSHNYVVARYHCYSWLGNEHMGSRHGRRPLPAYELELSHKCREIIPRNERSGMDTLRHLVNHLRYVRCAAFIKDAMLCYVELTLPIRTDFSSQ